MRANTQVFLNDFTTTTTDLTGKFRVYFDHLPTSIFRFEGQDIDKGRPRGVGNTFRKMDCTMVKLLSVKCSFERAVTF